MINFESQYFQKLAFESKQIIQFGVSARHDFDIADHSDVPDVVFRFSYDALIKVGIMLIARKGYKVRSSAGHHVKIIEKLSQLLDDEDIMVWGDKMRQMRNHNLYDGGCFVGEKESRDCLGFVKAVFKKAGV